MNSTEQKILKFREKDPKIKAATIAKKLGVSRELVRIYLKKHGLPTQVPKVKVIYLCRECGKQLESLSCKTCNYQKKRVTIECDHCGKIKTILKSIYERTLRDKRYSNKVFYCDQHCFHLSLRDSSQQ
jgi:tRNA G26 N,N-dimethylase Trm1